MGACEVAIIGGGAIGASTLYHLSKEGFKKTILIEQKENLGRGATGAWGSLIRVWHKNRDTTKDAIESVNFYLNFESHTNRSAGFFKTGSLYFLKKQQMENLKEQFDWLGVQKMQAELLSATTGRKLFPTFQWAEDDVAIFEPYAGYACPFQTTASWVESAKEDSAQVKLNTTIKSFECEGSRITALVTEKGEKIPCGWVILATGAWTNLITTTWGEDFPIYQKMIQVNQFHRTQKATAEPFFIDLENRTFGRPAPNGSFWGGFVPLEKHTPQKFIQPLSLKDANEAKQRLSRRLNWIKNAALTGGIRAVEGYTDELYGKILRSEKYSNLIITAGWSCCGFTLAPTIGKKITQMVKEAL